MGLLRKPVHERLEQIDGRLDDPGVRVRAPRMVVRLGAQALCVCTTGAGIAFIASASCSGVIGFLLAG